MDRIKEINIKTTDGGWWKLIINNIFEIEYEDDETIVNKLLVQMSVLARIWIGDDDTDYLGEQMYINTSNIVAIEVVR